MSMRGKKEYTTEIEECPSVYVNFGEIPEGSFFYNDDTLYCKIHPLYEDTIGQFEDCMVNAICVGEGCAFIFEEDDLVIPVKHIKIF